jgi:DNA-binding transcriptional LysR family regulator
MLTFQNRLIAMKNNPGPSLDDLSVFIAVCDAKGFRAAAKKLGLAPSNVSETIARLEIELGVPLLSRNTRSVAPTEAGRELEARLSPLFSEARAALYDIRTSSMSVHGLLKLNVAGSVMVDILPPLIDRFLVAHPAVRVELVVDDRLTDTIAQGCAAGIRYAEHLPQDMIAVPIGPRFQELALAAAPAYLLAHGHPAHPHDVMRHECVRLRFASGALTAWDFERDGEQITVDPPSRLIIGVDAAAAGIELARAGHGLICTFKNWLDPYFESGGLEPVLKAWWQRFDGPKLYFPSRRMPVSLRAFIDLIGETNA